MFNIPVILCNGDSTGSLEALNPNMNSGYTYSWQDLSGNIVSTTTTASNLPSGTYILYADYNNISGCTATDTAIVSELDVISQSAAITHIDCYGANNGEILVTVTGGSGPGTQYNMLWSPGGQMGALAVSLQAGIYTCTVTDANNCQQVDTFEVTQPQPLSVTVNQNGFILTASVPTGGTPPYSYSWLDQSLPITPLATGVTYVVSSYGTYSVKITDANGCEFISNSVIYEEGPLGLSSLDNSLSLNVYPNPFRQETTVDFGQKINKAKITIVDVFGKVIETHELADTDKYVIKRDSKSSGVYFMHIETNKNYINNIKLVIE